MNVWEGVDPFTEARQFCELWGVDGPVLVDVHGSFAERLGIRGVPTNIVVDDDGTVTCVGASTPQALEAAVRRLLGPDAPFEPAAGSDAWSWNRELDHIGEHVGRRRVDASGAAHDGAPGGA